MAELVRDNVSEVSGQGIAREVTVPEDIAFQEQERVEMQATRIR